MMKINVILKIVWLVMGVLLFFGITNLVFAANWDAFSSCDDAVSKVISDLSSSKNNNSYSVKFLTQNFCESMSNVKCNHDDDIFDANQSVFMTVLCDNVDKWDLFTKMDRWILLKTWFTQFGIFDYGFLDTEDGMSINFCDYNQSDMNGCDYSKQLPKLFDEIINDYFDVKQSDLYGVDTLKEEETNEDMANNFSKANFVGLEICDPDSDYYGKTCKTLKNYMWDVKNLLKSTNVIDVSKLIEWKDASICEKDFADNILYCGLLGDNIFPKGSFIDLVYNEYIRYRLFISYYSFELSVESRYSEFVDGTRSEKLDRNRDKVYNFTEQVTRSRWGMSLAFRSLAEISSSFAIHIWFLMYQEDAQIFMKNIAKIYPPVRTLYDKLRNVQKPE